MKEDTRAAEANCVLLAQTVWEFVKGLGVSDTYWFHDWSNRPVIGAMLERALTERLGRPGKVSSAK